MAIEAKDFENVSRKSAYFEGSLILTFYYLELWSSIYDGYRIILLNFQTTFKTISACCFYELWCLSDEELSKRGKKEGK